MIQWYITYFFCTSMMFHDHWSSFIIYRFLDPAFSSVVHSVPIGWKSIEQWWLPVRGTWLNLLVGLRKVLTALINSILGIVAYTNVILFTPQSMGSTDASKETVHFVPCFYPVLLLWTQHLTLNRLATIAIGHWDSGKLSFGLQQSSSWVVDGSRFHNN